MVFCCCVHLVQFSHLTASCFFIIGVLQSFKRCDIISICASLCAQSSPLFAAMQQSLHNVSYQLHIFVLFCFFKAKHVLYVYIDGNFHEKKDS